MATSARGDDGGGGGSGGGTMSAARCGKGCALRGLTRGVWTCENPNGGGEGGGRTGAAKRPTCGRDEADVVQDEARLPVPAVVPEAERDRPGPGAAHLDGAQVHPDPLAVREAPGVERPACAAVPTVETSSEASSMENCRPVRFEKQFGFETAKLTRGLGDHKIP